MSRADREREAFEAKIHEFVGRNDGEPYVCPDTVNEPMIRHWCEAMGDENPAYTDPNLAKDTVHGGIVAPPTMLQSWDMRGFKMYDAASLLPPTTQRQLHKVFDEAGYTGVVATDTEQEYLRYLRPGDQITCQTTIESISEQKATALGTGYFVVTRTEFSDQNGDEVGWLTFRVLKFKPANAAAAPTEETGGEPALPTRIRSPLGHDNKWWWDAIQQEKLLIQKCSDCDVLRHPPRPMCGQCQSTNWQGIEASGKGTVYSYTILHHPIIPGYDFPCPVGLIDLEEGTRIVANIRGCELNEIHIGMKVECMFEDVDDDFKLPFFYKLP